MNTESAGLTSKAEAILRMVQGEVFYDHGTKLSMTVDKHSHSRVRFVLNDGIENDIKGYWDTLEHWEVEIIEPEWYENITDPILCWVSDLSKYERSTARYVTRYDECAPYPYHTKHTMYDFATPVTAEDFIQED